MIIEGKVYQMKNEFCKELGIPMNQVERRLEELLQWLENFYDYEFYEGRPNRIYIKRIIGDYRPLPRKIRDLTPQKIKDYTEFTIASLGTEFKPNSKSKIAREAIDSFGYEKYSHTSMRAVTERYIKEPFNKYGETDNKLVWVAYSTYEPLNQEAIDRWRALLSEENINEEKAACAFYRQAQGEDVSEEVSYYKKALARFKNEFNEIPVLVKSWKLKTQI